VVIGKTKYKNVECNGKTQNVIYRCGKSASVEVGGA
jgi:hypothetical protein